MPCPALMQRVELGPTSPQPDIPVLCWFSWEVLPFLNGVGAGMDRGEKGGVGTKWEERL